MPRNPAFIPPWGSASGAGDLEPAGDLDASAGLWTYNLGRSRPDIVEAMHAAALAQIKDPDFGRSESEKLALALTAHTAGLSRVMLHTSGTSANEAALYVARARQIAAGARRKTGVVALIGCYHGSSFLLSMLGTGVDNAPIAYDIPTPADRDFAESSLAALERLLNKRSDRIGAFIFEPVMAEAGVIVLPFWWMEQAVALCRRHDVMVIADEVATGVGRAGAWSVCENLEVDAITVGKGLGCGFAPIAASVFSTRMLEPLVGVGEGIVDFGSTMDGYAVGCAVGRRVIEVLEQDDLVARADRAGRLISEALAALGALPEFELVRGQGLMVGLPLAKGLHVDTKRRILRSAHETLRGNGVFLNPIEDGFVIAPALTISDAEVTELSALLLDAFTLAAKAARSSV